MKRNPVFLNTSASRSNSPLDCAKNTTRLPCSTRFRASATATCMLPWKVIEGRVLMWPVSGVDPPRRRPCRIAPTRVPAVRPCPGSARPVRPSDETPGPDRSERDGRDPPAASKAFRRRRNLLGFIQHDQRVLDQPRSMRRAEAHQRNQELPAGKRIAGTWHVHLSAISRNTWRDFGYSSSGSSVASATFIMLRCVSTSKRRIDSIRSPNSSIRTGFDASAGKMSRMPPRSEYSPSSPPVRAARSRCFQDA